MALVKKTTTLFHQLPKEVEDLIYEFARDDKKKQNFVNSFEQMFTIWNIFITNLQQPKYVQVIDFQQMLFSIRSKSKKEYNTHFITMIGMTIHCHECFRIRPSFPSHLITEYSTGEW